MTVPARQKVINTKEHSMKTQQHSTGESTRTSARMGIRRRLSIAIIAVAAFASLALPHAGAAAGNQTLASDSALKHPPGWCYYEPFGGWHPCAFVFITHIWPD